MSLRLRRPDLISDDYLGTQVALHLEPRGYGGKGSRWAATVLSVATRFACGSVLDYGCGQGSLARALLTRDPMMSVREYDPAVSGKSGPPSFADLVVCTDVLEHIEPDRLGNVLAHLHTLARRAVFVVISTRPSNKTLPDGRNAHLIQESPEWWQDRCEAAGFAVGPPPDVLPEKQPGKAWVAVLEPQ